MDLIHPLYLPLDPKNRIYLESIFKIVFLTGNRSDFYIAFSFNHQQGSTIHSVIIINTESIPILYSVEFPGARYSTSGIVSSNAIATVTLPDSVSISSHQHQDRGVYLTSTGRKTAVIGQSLERYTTDTFLAFPILRLCLPTYVYYGMSVARTNVHSYPHYGQVLIVGTESNTMLKLVSAQSVTISIGNVARQLVAGIQYTFVINRFETVYFEAPDDLTGTRAITNKPITMFSGHNCANVPYNIAWCDYIIEQIPPVALWGQIHYVAPLQTRRSYSIKILAAYDNTNVDIYCDNSRRSYTISERRFVLRTLGSSYCAIHSSMPVLVAQFGHGQGEDNVYGDPFMTLISPVHQYSDTSDVSTMLNPLQTGFQHFINVFVLASYYQPDMIYLTMRGSSIRLNSQRWVPIRVNNVVEAYAAQVSVSEGVARLFHTNTAALLSMVVYGFAPYESYGHQGLGVLNPMPGNFMSGVKQQLLMLIKNCIDLVLENQRLVKLISIIN